MNDNEIIKALECCKTTLSEIGACKECPLYQGEGHTCITTLSKNALDLINRQKAEIERLNLENLQMVASIKSLKAEAIKHFAERLKNTQRRRMCDGYIISYIPFDEIDNLVKEMVGDAE